MEDDDRERLVLLESFASCLQLDSCRSERLLHGFEFPSAFGDRVHQAPDLSSGSRLASLEFVNVPTVRRSAPSIFFLIFLNEDFDQLWLKHVPTEA